MKKNISKREKFRKILKLSFSLILIFTVLILLLKFLPIKNLNSFMNRQNSTRFYDSKGNLIYVLSLEEGLRREYYPIEEIPEQIQKIFIEAEDKDFFRHHGFSVKAFLRAIKQNSSQKKTVSGASTITMQLVRLISPRSKNPTVFTKIAETFIAFRLELKLSKEKILELYLNNLPFGNQIEGIASAAREIYSKSLEELSTAQILALSVTPRRPSLYSPLVNPENSYESAMKIARNLDFKISKAAWISETKPFFTKKKLNAPHYISFIKETYAKNKKNLPDKINLSLNSELNNLLEELLSEKLELFSDSRIKNAGAVAIENETGAIIAYIGNPDFSSKNAGEVDSVKAKHQSGSSTKPFLYALALENGYKPNQILPDIPKDFGGKNVYVPLNFNNRYNGPEPLRVCLASSLNIPAVDILYTLGVDKYFNFLLSLGFDSLNGTRSSTGLSLALGSNEISLLELARAFSIFANDGILKEIIFSKDDYSEKKQKQVIKKDTARIICDFLQDRNAQTLGFGNAKVFSTNYPAIFKTGTANQFQDILSLSSTSAFTVAVWMGNLNGETVIRKTGSSIPALVSRCALDFLTENGRKIEYAKPFKMPESYKKEEVCFLSGMKPTQFCPETRLEFIENFSGDSYKKLPSCTWHYSENGTVKIRYPSEYQHWASGKNINKDGKKSSGKLEIMYPTNNAVFFLDDSIPESVQKITILCSGGKEERTDSFLDGFFYQSAFENQAFSVPLTKGMHTFTIQNGKENRTVTFTVK